MFCNKCGTQTVEGSSFCSKCGASLTGAAPALEPIEVDGATWTPGSGMYAGYYISKERRAAGTSSSTGR